MKLIVDSSPVELPTADTATFPDYCRELMNWLLSRNRAIGTMSFDGHPVLTIEQAETEFAGATVCEVVSVPLSDAMKVSLRAQMDDLDSILERCRQLVTDSLLAEAPEIATAWQDICARVREQITLIPQLAGLLRPEEIEDLVSGSLTELNSTMRDIGEVLNRADVVGFSDILEFRLVPWLERFRSFLQTQHDAVESRLTAGV